MALNDNTAKEVLRVGSSLVGISFGCAVAATYIPNGLQLWFMFVSVMSLFGGMMFLAYYCTERF